MASDSLNEVGRYIKKTRDNADYALKRGKKRHNKVERTRDVFTDSASFIMFFRTEEDERVWMDLNFSEPPPGKGLGGGIGFLANCVSITTDNTDHIVYVGSAYDAGTVTVYMNGAEYDTSKWDEYNPDAGEVFVKGGPRSTNTITICYQKATEEVYVPPVVPDTTPPPSTTYWDSFDRTASSSLGTADSGGVWDTYTFVPGGASLTYGTDGSTLYATTNNGGELTSYNATSLVGTDFTQTVKFKIDRIPNSATNDRPAVLIISTDDGSNYVATVTLAISSVEGSLTIGEDSNNDNSIGGGESSTVSKNIWTTDTYYYLKWERTASVSHIRLWLEGDTEPAGWDLTYSGTPSTRTATNTGILLRKNSSIAGSAVTFNVDYIDFSAGAPVTTAYYLSPTGNDSNNGSISAPWRTISKAYSVMVAGDITYCRGGSYIGNLGDCTVIVTSAGTSTNPIKLEAYPNETPVFDGFGAAITSHNYNIQFKAGAEYHEVRGLTFKNWAWNPSRGDNGSANIITDETDGTIGDVNHITIDRCTATAGVATPSLNDWVVYVSGASEYITITNNRLTGGGTPANNYADFGGVVQMYHVPAARHITVDHNLIGYSRFGVNAGQSGISNLIVTHNTFHHNYYHTIMQYGDTLLVRDNVGDANPGGETGFVTTGGVTNYTHDHNYSNQVFTGSNYKLTAGSLAIDGASDGTDAGWIAYP